jgi:hypothetical protein
VFQAQITTSSISFIILPLYHPRRLSLAPDDNQQSRRRANLSAADKQRHRAALAFIAFIVSAIKPPGRRPVFVSGGGPPRWPVPSNRAAGHCNLECVSPSTTTETTKTTTTTTVHSDWTRRLSCNRAIEVAIQRHSPVSYDSRACAAINRESRRAQQQALKATAGEHFSSSPMIARR